MPGPSVFPSGEPGVSGDFWGSQDPRVPLRGEGSCGGGGAPRDSAVSGETDTSLQENAAATHLVRSKVQSFVAAVLRLFLLLLLLIV